MNDLLTILMAIIILIGVIFLVYIILYNNIQAYKIKVNEAESVIDDLLRKKYDSLLELKEYILTLTDIDDKSFNQLDLLKEKNYSSFDFERNLTVINNLVDQIALDYFVLKDDEKFSFNYEEMYKLNEKLEATKTYYNNYITLLNTVTKKFPSNLIARMHHIKTMTYFDGKDLFDDEKEDFKL